MKMSAFISARNAAVILACAFSFVSAQISIRVNEVGYEKTGSKRAIIQSSAAIAENSCNVVQQGSAVHAVSLGAQTAVPGWSGRNFKVADFSEFKQNGKYILQCGAAQSQEFSIGEKILQTETGSFQIRFFKGMRNTDEMDRNLPIRGSTQRHNIYGGWSDATGDRGKHLSHLSYANYFNPQQIPLVAWALLQANEFQPAVFGTAEAKEEAAWGADYLLRALSTDGYFYSSVFDDWNQYHSTREICAWSNQNGTRSNKYEAAMREGGGMSIAALARASAMGISGDSASAQYLAGAKRAYAHLKANPTAYQDNGKENIIDDYCGLLAATELYNATQEGEYLEDAQVRAASLMSRQSREGWFYTHKDNGLNERPFYHAADEGLPIVALARYAKVFGATAKIREAVKKNLEWYADISSGNQNPFEYAKMYGEAGAASPSGAIDIARNGTPSASREQAGHPASAAFDGNGNTYWSSLLENGTAAENNNQWLAVDLGSVYKVDSVVLNWEAAYGKHYRIEVSPDGSSWTSVFEIDDNASAGTKKYKFASANARHVRMYGIERGSAYGFALYQFQVYGEPEADITAPSSPARFFMPHENETGYWWQGENARIASLSAAFTMGAQLADPSGELWDNSLFSLASAQLDWILGKNPFGVTMMHGFGKENYPTYDATNPISNIKGGICNGITGGIMNENDVQWRPKPGDDIEAWGDWRYIEQWLPHNAWYLTAVAALSRRIDGPIEFADQPPAPIASNAAKLLRYKVSAAGGNIKVELPFAADNNTSISLYSLRGQKMLSHSMEAGAFEANIKMQGFARGVYLLIARDAAGKAYTKRFLY